VRTDAPKDASSSGEFFFFGGLEGAQERGRRKSKTFRSDKAKVSQEIR
jgi:hypothetical protein